MNTIAVFLRRGSKWNPDLPVRKQAYWYEHAHFMDALFDAGKVILAGPFADESGSMVILAVESADAARAIFREDPWAHQEILIMGSVEYSPRCQILIVVSPDQLLQGLLQ